ncbi:class I SAM-dependent methyltransferase [Micromonospora sp. NBC_01796]|uniref:class I SAM-dependent methyltransferase n=1 Tax=Micromonospora sp. NBC_01796 TaxID=2975987 RepID=UPI002DDC2718|nr:class I SAM-dependent methyltransferase [Micromonospora sp. NBC_01796]WSA84162.1 class I SAM-dependent methyltransferase [Micromonospora sp. NBC_01796]
MAGEPASLPAWQTLTEEQSRRWTEVLDHVAAALPSGVVSVVIDGGSAHAAVVADRLADALHAGGRPCARLTGHTPPASTGQPPLDARYRLEAGDNRRTEGTPDTVTVADGSGWLARPPSGRWDVVVWLRTPPVGPGANGGRGAGCDIVVDLHDPTWPVIRHLSDRLAPQDRWYLSESRAFFATRAATWDTKFGDDLPAYAAAVNEADLPVGGVVVDIGCGTGRALPALRDAVGPYGVVIGLDLTPQMLTAARAHAGRAAADLLLGDARNLPLADASVDAVFAAGLLTHLPDSEAGLRELARITRPGGRLVLFHPSGRAALAARHGRPLRPDEPLAEAPLRRSTGLTGWHLNRYDDPPHRFFATATRRNA